MAVNSSHYHIPLPFANLSALLSKVPSPHCALLSAVLATFCSALCTLVTDINSSALCRLCQTILSSLQFLQFILSVGSSLHFCSPIIYVVFGSLCLLQFLHFTLLLSFVFTVFSSLQSSLPPALPRTQPYTSPHNMNSIGEVCDSLRTE